MLAAAALRRRTPGGAWRRRASVRWRDFRGHIKTADVAVPSRLQGAICDLAAALNVLAGPGPAGVSGSIAAANHAAELIDNRPLAPRAISRSSARSLG